MKPRSTLRNLLVIAASSLLAMSSASAITYTWTQTATGNQDWTTAGNWLTPNDVFVSGSGNELRFFAGITAPANQLAAGASQVVINVPSTLSMNTLTLNGIGPNSTLGSSITIGTSASTWTIGDGTTSTVNLNSAQGGGSADRDIRYTIAANLELNGGTSGITTFTGASQSGTGAVFSGNITETASGKGITKSGASLLIFPGSNSYTGTTLVSGGTLRLNSATALSGGIGATGGTSALTISGTGVVELGAGNFQRNLGTGSDQFQITGTSSGFSAIGGPRVITVNNDASQELQWGSTSFAPTKLVLNAASANDSLELTNKIDLNGATRTVVVNANKALLSGNIQQTTGGTAGLTKEGVGTLVLTGNNTYDGSTTITGGTLSVGATSNFGSGTSGLIMNAGTLQITGTTLTSITGLGHAVTFSNNLAKGFDIHNAANTFTVDQVLNQGTGTLTKSGAGTLVLNQDNTFTGATTATGGGTLVLDYSTNSGSKIGNAALNLNGTNLVLRGGGVFGQAVTSIVLAANTGSSISRDGSSATLANTGAITGPGQNTNSNLTIAEAGIVSTTTANDASGIQTLGKVTVGSHFATKDAGNLLQAYSIPVPAQYTAGGGGGTTAVVNQLTGGGNMTGTLTSYSLRIVNSGDSNILTLGANNLTMINGGTVLYAGGSDNNYTINGTTGQVKVGSGNQSLNMNIFTGTLTVNANLGITGTGSLVKAGAGTLVVGGTNASAAPTYIQQGTLLVNNTTGSGTGTGTVIVQTGATLGGTGTIGGNTTINSWGKLTFDLSTAPGSHDKLDINTAKTLTFSGDSVLTITSSGGTPGIGLYTLVTAAGGIIGSAPTTVNLPVGWAADAPQIVGNDLQINITSTGSGGDVTPPTLSSITDNASGGPVTEDASVTYTVTFSEDIATTLIPTDFNNEGTAALTINSVVETGLNTGIFTVVATPTTPGTLKLRIPAGKLVEDTSGNDLVLPVSDDIEITVKSKYEAWSGALDFDTDTNGDGVKNGLAFLLGAANKTDSALTLLPTVTQSGGNLILTFNMLNVANRKSASIQVQQSRDLGISDAWVDSAVVPEVNGGPSPSVNGVTFNVTLASPTNAVVATVAASEADGTGKLFGRLKANQ